MKFKKAKTIPSSQFQEVSHYKQSIFEYYVKILENNRIPILSSGVDEKYEGLLIQHYPIDIFIETPEWLIIFEIISRESVGISRIQTIVNQRFHLLSQHRPIIGIIESCGGYDEISKQELSSFTHPLVLTQECQFIMWNSHARYNKLISRVLFPDPDADASEKVIPLDSDEMCDQILSGPLKTKIYFSLLERMKYGSEIAQEVGKYSSSVYRALETLETAGIIKSRRCSTKYRRVYYYLTPRGLELKDTIQRLSATKN